MLYWALMFLIVALIAGVLGFTGVAVAAAGMAKILFVVFLVLFLISIVAHRRWSRSPPGSASASCRACLSNSEASLRTQPVPRALPYLLHAFHRADPSSQLWAQHSRTTLPGAQAFASPYPSKPKHMNDRDEPKTRSESTIHHPMLLTSAKLRTPAHFVQRISHDARVGRAIPQTFSG